MTERFHFKIGMGVLCEWACYASGRVMRAGVLWKWAYCENGNIISVGLLCAWAWIRAYPA